MELKEMVIIFINAASMAFGYFVVIYSIYNLFVRQKISFSRRGGKSCVKSIKTNLLGENYGRNNFYQGGFST